MATTTTVFFFVLKAPNPRFSVIDHHETSIFDEFAKVVNLRVVKVVKISVT